MRKALCIAALVLAGCQRQTGAMPWRENSTLATEDDCGLTNYPASKSPYEIVADAPHDAGAADGSVTAKVVIDADGRVKYMRVTHLAYPDAKNANELNAQAVESIRDWPYSLTMIEGRPVPICSDVGVEVPRPQTIARR